MLRVSSRFFRIHCCSELEAIVFAPLLHDLHEVFHLGVRRVLQHVNDLNESFFVFSASDNKLEYSDSGSSLAFPEFGVGIQALKHVKGLHGEVELAHLIAVVGDQVKQRQTFIRCLHVDVDVPSEVWLLVHDVATAQPRQVAVVLLVSFVLDLQESFFRFFVLACGGRCDAVVPVEVVVVDEVRANRLQINKHIVELLKDEEAGSHALTTWDGIALRRRGTDHLKEVLGDSHVVFLVALLADNCVHDGLDDVLLGKHALHILDQCVSLVHLVVLEVVDN